VILGTSMTWDAASRFSRSEEIAGEIFQNTRFILGLLI
jgi:hypothetical protein